MRVGAGIVAVVVLLAIPVAAGAGTAPPKTTFAQTRQLYLTTAEQGLADVHAKFWDAQRGWYDDFVNDPNDTMPLARLWSAFPLFETLVGVATADPTPANKAGLRSFADKAADLYWNPRLVPVGGYEWYPGLRSKISTAYFDDSGWWGLAFVDAYRATGDPRYLAAAHRAFVFIVGAGWDSKHGGIWWETQHRHKTIEPLAAAVLIGTWLYKERHRAWYLGQVDKLTRWADAHSFNRARGLYQRNAGDATVMDYAQGLFIAADAELCRAAHRPALCAKARRLADAAARAFPLDLSWSPSYDVVYVRWMLDYYRLTHDSRWYQLAAHNAQRALANARASSGLWSNDWTGKWIADGLQHDAATLELFAWTAAAPAPG